MRGSHRNLSTKEKPEGHRQRFRCTQKNIESTFYEVKGHTAGQGIAGHTERTEGHTKETWVTHRTWKAR